MAQIESEETRQAIPANDSLVGKTRMQDDPELELVWIEFKESQSTDLKNNLLERYLHIVRYTADRLHMKLPQLVDVDDLYSAGLFGLMDAIDNYDLTRGVKFESYCLPSQPQPLESAPCCSMEISAWPISMYYSISIRESTWVT